ncbi:hypothetical protein LOD99_10705 [Oopsacas minuta]|uniref:CCHC-type domain-containing protein n=1 Tax=Oopsacas minuta TaxID=111878 RepID=A0AAV7KE96_9METZ|nr:hypothetical protein LOD99_10705 [Oopsacas minuta]
MKLLETLLLRIRDRFKKAKRSLDCLEGEWRHSNIPKKPELKKNHVCDVLESSSDDGEVPIHSVATVAKEIIVSGRFCNLSNKHVPVDKALFLLDLLQVGRRKYTQLRHTLLPDNIDSHLTVNAIELFTQIDDIESFFALSTNERFKLTHQPISEINMHPASQLHSYTGVFRWFNLLVYHLRIEKFTWSPTSPVIKESMKFLQTFIQEKTGLKVDQPNSSGGTTSTGNVARRAFSDETEYLECILSTVAIQYRLILSKIHTQLSAILRVFNSSHKANILELGKLCKDTYLVILDSFPWASMTPTLHKLLAHSEELIRESNSSCGLKAFLAEGKESCTKSVRKYRENLARKVSFETNIMDIFVRLTSQSYPTLVNYRTILTCERCGQSGHTTRSKCCNAMNNQKTSIQTLFTTLTSNTDCLS